ncbi:MAG: PSD1 and planctomycete cytochrome C domain-containing protein [Akkermansiaceae bacterium]|nr:PSD1 and planctomycete cytochrome C domain-containing protein [Akkermansiaceae bacterium]
MTRSSLIRILPFLFCLAITARAEDLSFSRDVRPILSDACYKCHGPDDKELKGGLQLSELAGALKGGKSGEAAIVPGKPSASEMIKRLHSDDPDERMPPPSTKKNLTPEQIVMLEKWIASGAKYEKHWAFQAPVAPPVPKSDASNPIDAFVQSTLAPSGLKPSPEADKAALYRRASFDLIGLPPTPEDLAAYLADRAPDAYEKSVDRLLASPQYGERWTRKWLDLARYADTNGYEKDNQRTIWPYRDWVIKALNEDMPFDRFTIEQIAGDLLPGATTDQRIATGFHRNSMLNEEGGIDPLEFRFKAMVDRVATTGATWLGLTLQCCQCHTHKYDPIPHREYYSMMAFLDNADEPVLELPTPDQERQAPARIAKADEWVAALPLKWPVMVWTAPVPTVATEPAEATRPLGDGSVLFLTPGPEKSTSTLRFPGLKGKFTHLRLEALTDDSLPGKGPGRTAKGNFVLSELEVRVDGQLVKLTQPTANVEQPGYPVTAAIDGKDNSGWAVQIEGKNIHENKTATFTFETPADAKGDTTVVVKQQHGTQHTIGRMKISFGAAAPATDETEALRKESLAKAFSTWLDQQKSHTANWQVVVPVKATSNLPLLTIQPDATVFVSGDITKADTYQVDLGKPPEAVTAIRLEALPDPRLPGRGPGMAYYEGPKGDFLLGEFQLTADGQPVKIAKASQSYAKNTFGPQAPASFAIDGNPETGWSCAKGEGRAHEAVFQLEKPLTASSLNLTMMFGRHYACSLGKFRISLTTQSGELLASQVSTDVQPLIYKPDRTEAETQLLKNEFLLNAPELVAERKKIDELRRPESFLTSLVLQERPAENPRRTFIHNRGEWTQPTEPVEPGVLSILNPLPAGAPKNRLGFARWLVSRDNPLTARVVVNRAWATFFGRGIVKTQEDFGFQSSPPSHPQLLDWLAIRFMDDGWSLKKLHRLIVTSQTYKQSSSSTSAGEEKDPENILLWRGPRLRLDAEEVRDSALRSAGLLSNKMMGPSVFPPQPASVTTEGTFGALTWKTSTGEDRYRRSLYTFVKRTAPFAFANTFDAPTGEACIVRRDKSNTPLQALSLLNDVTIIEAAQALGKHLVETPGTPEQRTSEAFVRCFSRAPSPEELAAVIDFYQKQQQRFTAAPEAAKSLAGDGPAETIIPRATWTAVARALMNMDEFVTKS